MYYLYFLAFLHLTLPIIVDRERKESRRETIQAIKERAQKALHSDKLPEEDRWPQLAIFPEGTCTNRSQLISFKSGEWDFNSAYLCLL